MKWYDQWLVINEWLNIKVHLQKSGCIRLQSDGILVISGIPAARDDHLRNAIAFACDLQALVRLII